MMTEPCVLVYLFIYSPAMLDEKETPVHQATQRLLSIKLPRDSDSATPFEDDEDSVDK
jgi:hypothetical protein